MRAFAALIVCVASLVSVTAAVNADDAAIPNLKGTWTGEYEAYFYKGTTKARMTLEITEQTGAGFRGFNNWQHLRDKTKPLAVQRGKPVTSDKEPIMGVVGFDGKTLHIVEQGDGGWIEAELVGPDTMTVIYSESGDNALIYRSEFTRQQGAPAGQTK
jgi:hypothetical protein